ncbi:MAG TPA: hypothetical protein VE053_03040 [Allosphingosinicella sp.]|nr:hypothetical protein [Allosphingosinicella sp.]
MFERLMLHGAALARKAAARRRSALSAALSEAAPEGVTVSEEGEEIVILEGLDLERRFALEPELRWLPLRQARDERGRRR